MGNRKAADILVENGCYINTRLTGEPDIKVPDGSSVRVYLSCRRLISKVEGRKQIEASLTELVRQEFQDMDLIVGLATAGIGWAHAVAANLELPLAYVRSGVKGYGVGKLVEGDPEPGSKAVVIDDVLYTGGSLFNAMTALREEKNINTIGAASIITLNGGGVDEYKSKGVNAAALTDHKALVKSAHEYEILSSEEVVAMLGHYASSMVINHEGISNNV